MASKEVLFKYHSSSVSKKINKDGTLSRVFKVTLQDEHHEYKLVISNHNPALHAEYPEGCELPVQLNKTCQAKLSCEAEEPEEA